MGVAKVSKPLGYQKTVDYPRESQNAYYYTEGAHAPGVWHGKLAEKWGLVGAIDMAHYDLLAAGKHPHTGEQLIKHRLPAAEKPAWDESVDVVVDSAPQKYTARPGEWNASMVSLRQLWRDLGGPELRPGNQKAFWRGGDGPAISIDTEKGLWHDFVSGEGGGTIALAATILGCSNGEAAKYLREHYAGGLALPIPKIVESVKRRPPVDDPEKIASLKEMHRVAAHVFAENLSGTTGATGRAYLDSRNVSSETRQQFALGLSDTSGTQLVRELQRYGPGLMAASGLFVKDGTGEFRDRFRGRLMFPVHDATGDVIAFAGRKLSDDDWGAKYLNSPETDLYKKREVLYNLHRASETTNGRLVIVEGYLDAIAAHAAGVRNVVALSGTALSEEQAKVIAVTAKDVVLNLDADEAGRRASEKHVSALVAAGIRVNTVDLSGDPDEFIKSNGHDAYRAEINAGFDKLAAVVEAEKKSAALHVASWDLQVSPHKSYSASALVGGDKRIVDWHNNAVVEMLDAGEAYAQARMGKARLPFTTGNWATATFVHDTARPVPGRAPDPQLHTHCVIMNMTEANGKPVALLTWEIFRIQSYMNAVYESSLAAQARAGGYQLEHGKNFSTRIKGFSDEYLESISARKNEIEAEKERLGLSGAAADEIINRRLRQPKQEWEPAALKAEHRRQAEEFGQSTERIVAESRQRHVVAISPAERHQLAHKAISHARDRLFEHQAVNDHYEIMRDALRFGLGKLRLPDVEKAFAERQELVRVGHYRENAPGARYSTLGMQRMERASIDILLAGQGKTTPIAASLTRDQFREQYKARDVDGKRIELNDSQMWMAYRVLTSPNQYMVVRGAAGTGKSTAMEPIAEIAERHKQAGYEVRGLASTSGAAHNLKDLGIESGTLQAHNLAPIDPAEKKRLYILDEGSLVGTRQFHAFLQGVRPQDRVIIAYDPRQHQAVEAGRIIEEMEQAGVATFKLEKSVRQRNNPELLAVVNLWKEGHITEGLKKLDDMAHVWQVPDRKQRFQAMAEWYAQHPDTLMIAPDNRTIAELNAAARVELRKIEKLGPDVYEATILVGARDVREADRKLAVMYEPGNVIRWGKGVAMLGVKSGDYTQVVRVDAEKNHVTISVNGAEKAYNPRLAFGVEIYNAEKRRLAVGERIQITRPWRLNKNERIANRAMATITEIDSRGRARIEMEDGKRVRLDVRQMPHLDYAYAMTSYSLQYATAQNVLLHIDTGDSRIRSLVDKSLVYVGGSRAAETLHVFTDSRETLLGVNSPVNRAVLKPKGLSPEEISERSGYAVAV